VREDVTLFDIATIYQGVGAVADITREVSPDSFERTLTLLIDGVARERTPTPMLALPPDVEQLVAIMSRQRR
jgi:hypothetical protein